MCQTDGADDEAGQEHRTGFLASGEKPSQPEAFTFSYSVVFFSNLPNKIPGTRFCPKTKSLQFFL